jgi:hypothetical protein
MPVVDSDNARPETIGSRHPPDLPRRGHPLVLGLLVILAVAASGSTWAAIHYHQRAARLQSKARTAAWWVMGRTPASPTQPTSRRASSPASVAATEASAPPLRSQSYDLDTGKMQTTVHLTAAASDGGGSAQGQLLVTALIRGATPGARYRLTGGVCDTSTAPDVVWAQGIADPTGIAYLSGDVRVLPKGDQYFLTLDPWNPGGAADPRLIPGLEGDFVLGQADSFVGHVNRVQGVGGGECVIGP